MILRRFGVALVFLSSVSALRKSENGLKREFIQAMQQMVTEKQMPSFEESLQERLLQAARKVTPELAKELHLDERDLYYYGNNYGYNSYSYNNYGYNSYYQSQGYMDYNEYDGGYSSSVNLTTYALKYVGCQNIHTWSDERVANGLSPMKMDRFVILRLCDADTCSAYNKWGCNYNYGEYVLPMEDYLSIMSKYHFQQYNRYCQTCYDCMNFDSDTYFASPSPAPTPQQTYNDDAAGDDAYAANDDAYNGGRRRTQNYYNQYNYQNNNGYNGYSYGGNSYYQQQKQLPWYLDENGDCMFQTVCQDFRKACQNYHPNATFYEDYFTCTQFQVGNQVGYLGPHCRSDMRTIGIGIYDDDSCNKYIGDVVDIDQYTSMNFDDEELSLFYDKSCISCKASDGYSLIKDSDSSSGSYQAERTYSLCGALYTSSAKCNLYMSSSSDLYISEKDTEETVCAFIGNLIENEYNEFGDVIIQTDFTFSNWFSAQEYVKLAQRASPAQIAGLLASIITTLALLIYSCYLQKKLVFRMPWRPPKKIISFGSGGGSSSNDPRTEAGRLSRMNSGIVAMRSYDGYSMSEASNRMVHGDLSYGGNHTQGDMSTLTPSQGAYA